MAERKWNSGPPPHVGWWNASRVEDNSIWRWWDGRRWSSHVHDNATAAFAAHKATDKLRPSAGKGIWWTTYWPAGARVERSKP